MNEGIVQWLERVDIEHGHVEGAVEALTIGTALGVGRAEILVTAQDHVGAARIDHLDVDEARRVRRRVDPNQPRVDQLELQPLDAVKEDLALAREAGADDGDQRPATCGPFAGVSAELRASL